MASKLSIYLWDGGSGYNDVEILLGYCKEEPVELLKSLVKTYIIHSYRLPYCRPINKYPANCSGLVIKKFDSKNQEEYGFIITKTLEDYKHRIEDYKWSGFDINLFEKSMINAKEESDQFDNWNEYKELYLQVYKDFKQVFDEINNSQEAVE